MEKNLNIAREILEKIGGRKNIVTVFHCATRLRFALKDLNEINEAALKKIDGVLGIKKAGTSFQIIIGPNVPLVYDELCNLAQLDKHEEIDENLDEETEKFKFS